MNTLYARTLSTTDLEYPPNFSTEDEAIEWCRQHVTGKTLANWSLSWALARLAPTDSEHGDKSLALAAYELNVDKGSANRLRWMGSVWTLEVVQRFDRLTHTHYQYPTKLMNKALESRDSALLENLLDIMARANDGEGNENDKTGMPRAWSVGKLKKTIQEEIEGIQSGTDDTKPAAVQGELFHGILTDNDGVGYFLTAVLHPNEAVWQEIGDKLSERGLLGQQVTSLYKLDETE